MEKDEATKDTGNYTVPPIAMKNDEDIYTKLESYSNNAGNIYTVPVTPRTISHEAAPIAHAPLTKTKTIFSGKALHQLFRG